MRFLCTPHVSVTAGQALATVYLGDKFKVQANGGYGVSSDSRRYASSPCAR
jgi:hypothetical protein